MYTGRKVYGNRPNVVTRSMSAALTEQVMSLKERDGKAKGEQAVSPEAPSDGLYGGYRGASSQSKSHGVFPSGPVSEVVVGESSMQARFEGKQASGS